MMTATESFNMATFIRPLDAIKDNSMHGQRVPSQPCRHFAGLLFVAYVMSIWQIAIPPTVAYAAQTGTPADDKRETVDEDDARDGARSNAHSAPQSSLQQLVTDRLDVPQEVQAIWRREATPSDDPLERILRIDQRQIDAQARKTQLDPRLIARACRLLGLTQAEVDAIANLVKKNQLGAVDFEIIEKVETVKKSIADDQAAERTERNKAAFNRMIGFTMADRAAFDGVLSRTGQRTLTLLRLDSSLSKEELAAAKKFRQFATAFYVNRTAIRAINHSILTPQEATAVRKFGESIEQRFQSMFFTFFSC